MAALAAALTSGWPASPERYVRGRARELGLADRIRYLRGNQVKQLIQKVRGVVQVNSGTALWELSNWLAHARALLFPSFAEGFGLPVVEALSVGTPVIATDLPAFREAAGSIPEYLDPLDGPARPGSTPCATIGTADPASTPSVPTCARYAPPIRERC